MSSGTNNALEALYELRQQREVQEDREELPKDLFQFIQRGFKAWRPTSEFVSGWHLQVMCHYLEAVSHGEIKRLQIWVPPGTMKTGTVNVFWPAWEWTWDPGMRYWTASYETSYSWRIAGMSRDVIQSEWFQARWGEDFSLIRDSERYIMNDKGGSRLATAPDSTGSGEHGHRIIIDDPINAKEVDALSRVTLDGVNNWYDGTVSTRGIDMDPAPRSPHARILVMQRLHESDLAAHMEDIEPWEILCLPERYYKNHPYAWHGETRAEGELLWPAQRDETASNALAKTLTAFRAAGQLQQMPASREGDLLKIHWWRFYDQRIREKEQWSKLPKFGMMIITVDTPQKDKETNDNIAIQCWGVRGADRYLVDLKLGKMNYGSAKRAVKEMARWSRKIWPNCRHYILIENAAYGVELIIDLKRETTGVIRIDRGADGDKIMRAETASDCLESGNCFVPGHGPPWQPVYDEHSSPADIVQFLHNCSTFPNAAHDDDVDAWSQGMNWLRAKSVAPMRTSSPHKR